MTPHFSVLPPEVNSLRAYTGAGPAPMIAAAQAWDGIAVELQTAAASFDEVTAGLLAASWQGPAATAMANVAAPYAAWLNTTAAGAEGTAAMARAAAAEFEATLSAMVHPATVAANRAQAVSLVAANLFGQNAPAIAAVESLYEQMWAEDVTAMAAYHAGASAVVAQLAPWQQQLQSLLGAVSASGTSAWNALAATGNTGVANAAAAITYGPVMGGSGTTFPSPRFVQRAFELYMHYLAPDAVARALVTPEALYPVVAIKNSTFDISVSQGVSILDATIRDQIAAGNKVSVFGYSQSATISTLEMIKLANSVNPPNPDQLSFTLIGNPNNPNGGVAARFPGITLPSLGISSSPATPDNLFPTRIYTLEYDGVADFPRYPLNFVSTINAIAGAYYVHSNYFLYTPAQIDAAIPLTNTVGPTMTEYFIIPTPNLPILEPLRGLPILGGPLADLIQPDLKVIVNLGYGDPNYGYSTSPPNVPTPFGVFPQVDPLVVANALAAGTQQGIHDFGYGMTHLNLSPVTDLSNLFAPTTSGGGGGGGGGGGTGGTPGALVVPSVDGIIDSIQTLNSNLVNTITRVAGAGYEVALPTTDVLNALVTTAPSYNVNLFLEGVRELAHGDPMGLINAVGYPLAADVALLSVAGALELLLVINAGQTMIFDISALLGG